MKTYFSGFIIGCAAFLMVACSDGDSLNQSELVADNPADNPDQPKAELSGDNYSEEVYLEENHSGDGHREVSLTEKDHAGDGLSEDGQSDDGQSDDGHSKGSHSEHVHSGDSHSGAVHAASGVGSPARAKDAGKVISVTMLDTMRYEFDRPLTIKGGDIVRFTVVNKGKLRHEFSIGDVAEQQQHAAMMREMPDMMHKDGNTLSLESGESGEITWRFEGDEEVVFACNIPGHFEAGMFRKLMLE